MAPLPAAVVNASGAGDCLVAGCLWSLMQGLSPIDALAHGMVSLLLLDRHTSIFSIAEAESRKFLDHLICIRPGAGHCRPLIGRLEQRIIGFAIVKSPLHVIMAGWYSRYVAGCTMLAELH